MKCTASIVQSLPFRAESSNKPLRVATESFIFNLRIALARRRHDRPPTAAHQGAFDRAAAGRLRTLRRAFARSLAHRAHNFAEPAAARTPPTAAIAATAAGALSDGAATWRCSAGANSRYAIFERSIYFFCADCSCILRSEFIHSVQSCGPVSKRFFRLASTLSHARSKYAYVLSHSPPSPQPV